MTSLLITFLVCSLLASMVLWGVSPLRQILLLCISQFLYEALDNHSQVDVVYTDFLKAFDMIDHNLLLNKLESFGFSDDLVLVVKSYLDSRLMCVRLKGFESRSFKQETGVPQGSVLGPLFFNIFINDLVASLDVSCLLCADDNFYTRSTPLLTLLVTHFGFRGVSMRSLTDAEKVVSFLIFPNAALPPVPKKLNLCCSTTHSTIRSY
jgi:hypothetical protein